eukprot:5076692-Prorocentrum_lima.AAC.1
MTSSLVGSGDVYKRQAARCARCTRAGCRARSVTSTRRRTASPGCSPVSYTHLTLPTICSV